MKRSERLRDVCSGSPDALAALLELSLTDQQKQYLTLYYRDRLLMREIADRFGVSTSTVSRTISRASSRLRRAVRIVSLIDE